MVAAAPRQTARCDRRRRRRLEDGTNHRHLTVGFLTDLAAALVIDVTDLFTDDRQPAPDPPETGNDPAVASEVARLGTLIAAVDAPVPAETLSEATGLPLGHIDDLLAALDGQLHRAGLRLLRSADGVSIQAAADVDVEMLARLVRSQHARRGMNRIEATVLWKLRYGDLSEQTLTNPGRVALARLGLAEDSSAIRRPGLSPAP